MDFQKALYMFDELLKNNNLPTDKLWVSWRNVKCTYLCSSQAYYSKIDESKRASNQISADQIAGDGDEYIRLNQAQKKLIEKIPEGSHLFINLENHLSESNIKETYDRIGKSGIVVFYAITVDKNKTICGLLFDWFGDDTFDNCRNFQMLPNKQLAFSANEMWEPFEISCITNSQEWTEVKALPLKLSNLDYLVV